MAEPVILVSNRGPVTFTLHDDGSLDARRGAGGLVSSMGSLARQTDALWIAAAISDGDRAAAAAGPVEAEGYRFLSLAIDPDLYGQAYSIISNATLWFLYHGLFDLPRRPRLDWRWREAWKAYRAVNRVFARAVVEHAPEGATVLVHDYQLSLVGRWLAEERADLRTAHFAHVPFCDPTALRTLPDDVATELLEGLAGHGACGFQSPRWADAFAACCEAVLGAGRAPPTFVSPVPVDRADLAAAAASPDAARELAALEEVLAGRRLIARVDRIEPSKNLLRGFLAFDELLATRPEWRGQVVFGAWVYPSRQDLAEYQAYRQEAQGLAEVVNRRWAEPGWTPILLDVTDNFPRSVAALRRFDVLLVNSVRDGLNLVAKEGPLLNERAGVLALSREAGAWEELGPAALEVNPFDVTGTTEVLAAALAMDGGERATRAARLRELAGARRPRDWLDDQLAAARAPGGPVSR